MTDPRVVTRITNHLKAAQKEIAQAQAMLDFLSKPVAAIHPVDKYPRFKMFVRQDKGEAFEQALITSGYESVHDWRHAQFVLADHDQRGDIRLMQRDNKVLFIHPHSARSMILWDGILPTTSFVKCNFVFTNGQKEVMQLYGYKRPIEVVGWTYCPIKPFTPSSKIERVLFAPIHPNSGQDRQGRRLMEEDQGLNRRTLEALRKLPVHLTVRYSGRLEDNGIQEYPDVTYQIADLTMRSSLQAIEEQDVIVGHQTFAYLAIASGKPTVMFGEDTPPHSMHTVVRSWDKYKHLLMYPLDILHGEPMGVLEKAACCEEVIRRWKQDFIGEAFNGPDFVRLLEKYLG